MMRVELVVWGEHIGAAQVAIHDWQKGGDLYTYPDLRKSPNDLNQLASDYTIVISQHVDDDDCFTARWSDNFYYSEDPSAALVEPKALVGFLVATFDVTAMLTVELDDETVIQFRGEYKHQRAIEYHYKQLKYNLDALIEHLYLARRHDDDAEHMRAVDYLLKLKPIKLEPKSE